MSRRWHIPSSRGRRRVSHSRTHTHCHAKSIVAIKYWYLRKTNEKRDYGSVFWSFSFLQRRRASSNQPVVRCRGTEEMLFTKFQTCRPSLWSKHDMYSSCVWVHPAALNPWHCCPDLPRLQLSAYELYFKLHTAASPSRELSPKQCMSSPAWMRAGLIVVLSLCLIMRTPKRRRRCCLIPLCSANYVVLICFSVTASNSLAQRWHRP